MNADRANVAHPMAARRGATSRRRQGRRAEVAAFEAWQRRQRTYQGAIPTRRTRRS
jgi:hypothetical protein